MENQTQPDDVADMESSVTEVSINETARAPSQRSQYESHAMIAYGFFVPLDIGLSIEKELTILKCMHLFNGEPNNSFVYIAGTEIEVGPKKGRDYAVIEDESIIKEGKK